MAGRTGEICQLGSHGSVTAATGTHYNAPIAVALQSVTGLRYSAKDVSREIQEA